VRKKNNSEVLLGVKDLLPPMRESSRYYNRQNIRFLFAIPTVIGFFPLINAKKTQMFADFCCRICENPRISRSLGVSAKIRGKLSPGDCVSRISFRAFAATIMAYFLYFKIGDRPFLKILLLIVCSCRHFF
jgi:hypothetical protein